MNIFAKVTGGIVGLVAMSALLGSFYTVDEGERAVVTTNGKVTSIAEPGLHLKVPFFQSASTVSVRSHVRLYEDVAAYSRDQQPAFMKVSLNYRIDPSQVEEVYRRYGSAEGAVTRIVDRKVMEQVKNVFGQYTAATAINKRERLNADSQTAIQAAVAGPLVIESFQIENIDYSDAYETSVENRMLAEVAVEKQQQEKAKETVIAETTVLKAKAQAEADKAAADATAYAAKAQGEAEAAAIRAKGEALSNNPGLIQLLAAERWDGVLPNSMVPGAAVPFVNVK